MVVFGVNSLTGQLALQFVQACVGRAGRFQICTNCLSPYIPKRAVQVGKNPYCDDCKKRSSRDAKARR